MLVGTFIVTLIRKKKKSLVKYRSKKSYEMVRVGIAEMKV